jgi:hypothetical protein
MLQQAHMHDRHHDVFQWVVTLLNLASFPKHGPQPAAGNKGTGSLWVFSEKCTVMILQGRSETPGCLEFSPTP